MMLPESIQVLELHKKHWLTLRDAGYIAHLEHPVKKAIEKVYQDEIDKRYHENLWCGDCVANMIRRIYTHYEKHLKQAATLPPSETPKKRNRNAKS